MCIYMLHTYLCIIYLRFIIYAYILHLHMKGKRSLGSSDWLRYGWEQGRWDKKISSGRTGRMWAGYDFSKI